MRRKPITFRHTLAAALSALALAAVVAPAVAPALADEGDEEESEPQVRGRRPPEEPDAEPQVPVKGLGAVRRPDPFDSTGAPPVAGANEAPPAARPDHGNVICEAGCDGPRGSVVYKPGEPPG
jgi:hypothetical protein